MKWPVYAKLVGAVRASEPNPDLVVYQQHEWNGEIRTLVAGSECPFPSTCVNCLLNQRKAFLPEEYDHNVYSQHIGKTVRFELRVEYKFAHFATLVLEGVIVATIPGDRIPPGGYEIATATGYYRVEFNKILGEVVHRVAVEPLEGIS